ncbi:glycosyltransferase [Halorussus caseinilyticus]|uniref:Glycosyltransferase n=1 Tax=Halorussus caseinilyticus TaxID=3034025 RepID=A0ABD5WQ88_9EURY|nr:glycosyltransferase [Halorussus sp. DT72]
MTTIPSEPLADDVRDLPAIYTWSFHSEAFADVRSMVAEYERPVSLSVVNSTYKRPDQTAEMVDSIRESVERFYRRYPEDHIEFECLVCCPADDRETVRRLRSMDWDPLRVLTTDAVTITGKRDAGIEAAENEYIVSIDSDCVAEDNWVESIHRSIKKHWFPGAIQGAYYLDYPPDRNWYTRYESNRDKSRFRAGQADSRNLVYRKDVYESIGGFNTESRYADVAEDNLLRKRITDLGAGFVMDRTIRVRHRYPVTLADNLKRFQYFGTGDHYVKEYSEEAYRNHYTPWVKWRQLLSKRPTLGELNSSEGVSLRRWAFRFLQLCAYTLGYLQGLYIYNKEKISA